MNDLTGQPGELKATITITRKATGKVETYELTGTAAPEQALPYIPENLEDVLRTVFAKKE